MASWGRVVAGVVIGVAGTVYATNEDVRKHLPKAARDLPDNVRRRYEKRGLGGPRGLGADGGRRSCTTSKDTAAATTPRVAPRPTRTRTEAVRSTATEPARTDSVTEASTRAAEQS